MMFYSLAKIDSLSEAAGELMENENSVQKSGKMHIRPFVPDIPGGRVQKKYCHGRQKIEAELSENVRGNHCKKSARRASAFPAAA